MLNGLNTTADAKPALFGASLFSRYGNGDKNSFYAENADEEGNEHNNHYDTKESGDDERTKVIANTNKRALHRADTIGLAEGPIQNSLEDVMASLDSTHNPSNSGPNNSKRKGLPPRGREDSREREDHRLTGFHRGPASTVSHRLGSYINHSGTGSDNDNDQDSSRQRGDNDSIYYPRVQSQLEEMTLDEDISNGQRRGSGSSHNRARQKLKEKQRIAGIGHSSSSDDSDNRGKDNGSDSDSSGDAHVRDRSSRNNNNNNNGRARARTSSSARPPNVNSQGSDSESDRADGRRSRQPSSAGETKEGLSSSSTSNNTAAPGKQVMKAAPKTAPPRRAQDALASTESSVTRRSIDDFIHNRRQFSGSNSSNNSNDNSPRGTNAAADDNDSDDNDNDIDDDSRNKVSYPLCVLHYTADRPSHTTHRPPVSTTAIPIPTSPSRPDRPTRSPRPTSTPPPMLVPTARRADWALPLDRPATPGYSRSTTTSPLRTGTRKTLRRPRTWIEVV